MKLLPLIFILLASTAFANSAPEITLNGVLSKGIVWSLTLKSKDAKHCRLEGVTSGIKKHTIQTPSTDECEALYDDLSDTLSEITHGKHPSRNAHAPFVADATDEPNYEFAFQGREYPVHFQAPEVCDVKKTGEMDCHKNKLSAAQRLLIQLRAKAHQMKLGSWQ